MISDNNNLILQNLYFITAWTHYITWTPDWQADSMEYKTRFHTHARTHVIVGYSMHKIQAATPFFAFAVRLLNTGVGDPSRPP